MSRKRVLHKPKESMVIKMVKRVISKRIIEKFRLHLQDEEKSANTIDKYIRDVQAFEKYMSGKRVNKKAVISYKSKLIEKNYAVRSINSMLASLNNLFSFLGWTDCSIKSIKLQKKVYCPENTELSKAEYMRLINATKYKGNQRLNLLLQTICCTGIRVSELKYITVEAVKKGEAVVTLKGKTRSVFIVKELKNKLLQYAAEKNIQCGSIFITRSGRPVSRTNIWRDMKNLCEKASVDPQKVFPHNLRHLFARIFYKIDKDIAKLADVLGHSSINTTRIYIISTGSEHRQQMENMKLII